MFKFSCGFHRAVLHTPFRLLSRTGWTTALDADTLAGATRLHCQHKHGSQSETLAPRRPQAGSMQQLERDPNTGRCGSLCGKLPQRK